MSKLPRPLRPVDLRRMFWTATVLVALSTSWSEARAQSVNVLSALVQEFHVVPGGSYTGHIVLENASDQTATVVVYQNDYYRREPGAVSFTEPGEQSHERSNLSWVTVSDHIVDVRPHERREVAFTIQVPSAGGLQPQGGTYWSTLLVEGLDSYQARTKEQGGRGTSRFNVSMSASFRTAVIIASSLPSPESPAVSFMNVSTAQNQSMGGHAVVVDLRNDSQMAIGKSKLWIELYDQFGEKRADLELKDIPIMLPGNVYRRQAEVPQSQLSPGVYRCIVILDMGGETLFGTQASVMLKSARS